MKGSRSKDNCYMWIFQPSPMVKSMKEIISEDGVKGFEKFKIEEGKIHDVCQVGKKYNLSYNMS